MEPQWHNPNFNLIFKTKNKIRKTLELFTKNNNNNNNNNPRKSKDRTIITKGRALRIKSSCL